MIGPCLIMDSNAAFSFETSQLVLISSQHASSLISPQLSSLVLSRRVLSGSLRLLLSVRKVGVRYIASSSSSRSNCGPAEIIVQRLVLLEKLLWKLCVFYSYEVALSSPTVGVPTGSDEYTMVR